MPVFLGVDHWQLGWIYTYTPEAVGDELDLSVVCLRILISHDNNCPVVKQELSEGTNGFIYEMHYFNMVKYYIRQTDTVSL